MLEIEVQGARQVRDALPEAMRIFIAPPSDGGPAHAASIGRGTDTPEQIERRLEVAERGARGRASEFAHVVVNDDLEASRRGAQRARRYRYSGDSVIKPRLDTLLEHVDSHYAVVLVAAKRARQINSYYHNLGEGTFDEYPPPMVETGSKNYLKIALEEIAAGKIKYRYRASCAP